MGSEVVFIFLTFVALADAEMPVAKVHLKLADRLLESGGLRRTHLDDAMVAKVAHIPSAVPARAASVSAVAARPKQQLPRTLPGLQREGRMHGLLHMQGLQRMQRAMRGVVVANADPTDQLESDHQAELERLEREHEEELARLEREHEEELAMLGQQHAEAVQETVEQPVEQAVETPVEQPVQPPVQPRVQRGAPQQPTRPRQAMQPAGRGAGGGERRWTNAELQACAVCLGRLDGPDEVKELECGHWVSENLNVKQIL
eukprot:gnl/TRDRNA2_/TRDRNA2_170509_c1_seq9.p2 gnl/TRDRNA2_/TRDRNA2_170509_c1~~gnl/TRDRNA2_/TRDRNA2_170509_c1_seq9.p2  ORF type:complete len:270 (+),score=62.63 gnl/TRDRNA2_/TRDRNA2_170509_c1_seq9:35-811(+)